MFQSLFQNKINWYISQIIVEVITLAVTIKDVAKIAKVNPSTVSRVIADSPLISVKTKKVVREVMNQLGYHPNINARNLVNQRTQSIGIVMPSSTEKAFQNPFFAEVIRGISSSAHNKKYSLFLSTGETEEEIYDGVIQMVQGKRVDGIILLYSRINDQIMEYLIKQNFPFAVIGKPDKNADSICYIDNDNIQASFEVTNYLIELGHERIAFIGGNPDLMVTTDRLNGYKHALTASGIPISKEYIVHDEYAKEGGQEAVNVLLSALNQPPTALIVADDLMAFGVLSTLHEKKIRVPEDISIISFNNLMLTEFSRPPLSSVDINIFQLGFEAVNCLIASVQHPKKEVKRFIVKHQLIKRDSCQ